MSLWPFLPRQVSFEAAMARFPFPHEGKEDEPTVNDSFGK